MDRYPFHALRSLLATDQPTRGAVTAVSGQRLTIATPRGAITAISGSESIRIGQTVTIRQGVAYPSASPAERYVI